MIRVAIIIPTMNRPDFILRQFEFWELTNSPHPVYVLDSSNGGNAQKIKDGIEKFKKLNITYQWAQPGKDHLVELLPLVKEKYCIQMGDDDIVIPETISECAEFLETHPDYATCGGKQVNIRFRAEDYIKSYGIIARQTRPFGRSFEQENMLIRIKDFWSNPTFICFTVRRIETEIKIRNITKNFAFMEYLLEFVLWSTLIISGKAKVINKLGYIMQISDNRYNFVNDLTIDYLLTPSINEKWKIVEDGLSEIIQGLNKSKEESHKIAKWMLILYLAKQFLNESDSLPIIPVQPNSHIPRELKRFQRMKMIILNNAVVRKILYRLKYSLKTSEVELGYFNDFKIVKDFLEKSKTP